MKKRQNRNLLAAGTALLVAEPVLAMAHAGGVGVIVGAMASVAAYVAMDDYQLATRPDEDEYEKDDEEYEDEEDEDEEDGEPSLVYRLLNGKSVRGQEKPNAQPAANGLPRRSPPFSEMAHLIKPGRDILGFDGKQFIVADSLKQSVNMGLIGLPHSGKTTCLTFHVAQAIMRGALIRGWDLHGDVAADLGDYFNIMEDVRDILADCRWLQAERDRRIALRKQARAGDPTAIRAWKETRELFYIVDELNALMLRIKNNKAAKDLVTDTLLSLIAEGRKFKMRCMIAGQTMPAALFGDGGSSARDILSAKYAFQSRDDQAQYFGIEAQAIKNFLPLIAGKKSAGYAVLDGGPLLHAVIISIPSTTVEDIRVLLDEYEGEDDGNAETDGNEGGNAWKPMETPVYPPHGNVSAFPVSSVSTHNEPVSGNGNAETERKPRPPEGVTWNQLDQITEAYNAGWKAKDVSRLVHLDGRKYGRFIAACEFLHIDFKEKA